MLNPSVTPRPKVYLFVSALAAYLTLVSGAMNSQAQAQTSTPIASASRTAVGYPMNRRGHIPDSRSAEYLRVEGILDRASALPQGVVITGADLVEAMNDSGLTVVVDPTAIDDSWSDSDQFQVPVGRQTMRSALMNLLRTVNATITLSNEGVVKIISFDNFQDQEFLTTILYDVSDLATTRGEAYQLSDMLQSSVHADSWEDSGTGEGTVVPVQRNGRVVLAIKASYNVHRATHRLLADYSRMTSTQPARRSSEAPSQASPAVGAVAVGSVAIPLPKKKTKSGLRSRRGMVLPGQKTTGAFGGGGAGSGGSGGSGGGVF